MIMNSNKVTYMGANSSDDHEQQLQVVVGKADNEQQQQQQQQQQHVVINSMIIRYKCSFCGRGFSNAQALGGHMNVHRRDRAAKFINSSSTSSSDHTSTHHHQSQLLPWINSTTKLDQEYQVLQEADDDNIHARLVHHHKPQHQLPLFVDTVVLPSRLISCSKGHEDDDLKLKEDDHEVVIDTKRQLMMHQPSTSCIHGDHVDDLASNDDRKLDLELRLGTHDPDDRTGTMSTTSTATTGTRDFF